MKIPSENIRDYHANDAISHSKLAVFMDSSLRFFERYIAKTIPPEETQAMTFGSAFHALMEGKPLTEIIAVSPFDSFRSKDSQAWKAAAEAEGRAVITSAECDALLKMQRRLKAHGLVQRLLAETEPEVTWRKAVGKWAVQCRTDRWREKYNDDGFAGPLIIDFKTLPSLGDFERHVINYNYATQSAYYQECVAMCLDLPETAPRPRVIFIACEKEPPYEVQPFEIDEASLVVARGQVIMALRRLRHCFETGVWTRPENINKVGYPRWRVAQIEQELIEQRALLAIES